MAYTEAKKRFDQTQWILLPISLSKGIKEKVVTEACKMGFLNASFTDNDAKNGSIFISPLLYYYVSPILNMDVLTNEEEMNMTGSL